MAKTISRKWSLATDSVMDQHQEAIELYKTYVETITANEHRRQSIGALYTSLIAAAGVLLASDREFDPHWIALGVLVISGVWLASVRYFIRLAQAKFVVIRQLEDQFSIKPFRREWQAFKQHEKPGETEVSGDDTPLTESEARRARWSMWTLTHYDQVVPGMAGLTSLAYLLLS